MAKLQTTLWPLSLLLCATQAHALPPVSSPGPALASDDLRDEGGESAEENDEAPVDRLFPGAGRVAITASSGVPHLALGEVTVGISPWFTMGAGATVSSLVNETSLFLRPRVALAQGNWWAVAMHMPFAYYPPSKRRDGWDWFLTNPAVFFRAKPQDTTSVYLGAGGVFASTRDTLGQSFEDPHDNIGPEDWDFSDMPGDDSVPAVNGAWNSLHAGADHNLGGGWVAQIDSVLILEGFRIAESYRQRVGVPFFVQAGATYVF